MNFEEYVRDEFKKGEKKFDKIETKMEIMDDKLDDIRIAMKVDEKLQAARMRNNGIIYGGISSLIVGLLLHLAKGLL